MCDGEKAPDCISVKLWVGTGDPTRLGDACKRLRICISLSDALRAPPLPPGEAEKERTNKLLKLLLPAFLPGVTKQKQK